MCNVSYDHNFLFVHIPKTAGKSLGGIIDSRSENPLDYFRNRLLQKIGIRVNHFGYYKTRRFRAHSTAALIKSKLPLDVYNSLFKFAYVRNPWDALVSQYHFVRSSTDNKRHKTVINMSFEEFLQWFLIDKKRGRQKEYVVDNDGNCIVDYIGRFERLAEDTNYILEKVGLSGRLQHIGPSKHRDYRTYFSDELAEFVGDILADDIEFFGYDFDGITSEPSFMQKTSSSAVIAA